MKKDIRMIGLDLDGTMLQGWNAVSPRVEAALRRAIDAGIVVLPATGRQLGSIPRAVLDIPGIRYALTTNGAKVFDLLTGEAIHSDCLSRETALSLLREMRGYNAATALYLEGAGYYETLPSDAEQEFSPDLLHYLVNTRTQIPSLEELIAAHTGLVEKFSLTFWDLEERARMQRAFERRDDCFLCSSSGRNLEVNSPTANKGSGLLALARFLGIQPEHIMAMGDYSNDIPMLRAAGYGVAMANALEDVKAAADAVTLPCAEDGAAVAIESLF